MTTGYTVAIETTPDLPFRRFALHCALAFSACIHQRDDYAHEPRHREVYPGHLKAMHDAEKHLGALLAMTPAEAEEAAQAAYAKALASHETYLAEKSEKVRRYARMRGLVHAWLPPSPVHAPVKKFMLEQINESVSQGGYELSAPKPQSGSEWLAEEVRQATDILTYQAEEHAKEAKRCVEANSWIDAFVASLPPEEGS